MPSGPEALSTSAPPHSTPPRPNTGTTEVDDRLVVDDELLLFESLSKLHLGGETGDHLGVHPMVEDLEATPPPTLGERHRRVRVTQKVTRGRAAVIGPAAWSGAAPAW